jgi:uncharacterized protein YfkK (UPF0435 family)
MKIIQQAYLTFLAFNLLVSCNQPKKGADDLKIVTTRIPDNNNYKNTVIEDAARKLQSNNSLSIQEIDKFAEDLNTRADFYNLLSEYKKENIFPKEYNSFEKAGESVLATWLAYPTELDTIPSKIELLTKIDCVQKDTLFTYYVY